METFGDQRNELRLNEISEAMQFLKGTVRERIENK